jgi:hypothetical protein
MMMMMTNTRMKMMTMTLGVGWQHRGRPVMKRQAGDIEAGHQHMLRQAAV